jgi:prepilin-type N-terminal cleavage/methylation domain-containing protein
MTARRGVSLIEVMIALVMLGIGLTGLAGFTVLAAQRATATAGAERRYTAALQVVDRLATLPYDSLAGARGCSSVAAPLPHTRCIDVAPLATNVQRVTVIITPSNHLLRPDTISFDRAKTVPANPIS